MHTYSLSPHLKATEAVYNVTGISIAIVRVKESNPSPVIIIAKIFLDRGRNEKTNDVSSQPVWPFLRLDRQPSKARYTISTLTETL